MGFQAEGVGGAELESRAAQAGSSLSLVVNKVIFKNPESCLFIAEGRPVTGEKLTVPADMAAYRGKFADYAPVTFKGVSPNFVASDPVGTTVLCQGSWVVDPTYGLQFDVLYVQDVVPTTPEALRKYLGSGRLKGIGPSTATAMVDRWGVDVLRILDEEPQKLGEIAGLTPGKIATIAETWKAKRSFYGLVSFLGQHGIGEGKAIKIQEALGQVDLEAKIRENPYLLTEVEGVGFKTADQVALSLGLPSNSPVRINAALVHILNERIQKDGHTAVPADAWVTQASAELLRPVEEIRAHCQKLINEHRVVLRTLKVLRKENRYGEQDWVADMLPCVSPLRIAAQENGIGRCLRTLRDTARPISAEDQAVALQMIEDPDRGLDPSQRHAAWTALSSPMSIITGGPGTGKTTTLSTVVRILRKQGHSVVLAAPTGRAAKRMAEAIGEDAKTMHRCLGYTPGKGFNFGPHKPMEGDVFIVDETSMVDTAMAHAWLGALPQGARMIWVGDADQLPSVGPGDVLRALIESNAVAVARLTKVHRQAAGSGIAWNARRILEGHPPSFSGSPWVDDFSFLKSDDNLGIVTHLLDSVDGFLARGFKHQDIQVLVPQKTGDVGVSALNDILRWRLNPTNPVRPNDEEDVPRFLVGERVLQTKNLYDLEVFNGDLGTIMEIRDDESLIVEMEDGRTVKYPRGASKDLQLGYASTVHKSQGGERPVVIMVCSPSHTFMLNRNLLYTGITRGRNKVVMIGSPKTALLAVKKRDELVRTTGLTHEIARCLQAQPRPPRPNVR